MNRAPILKTFLYIDCLITILSARRKIYVVYLAIKSNWRGTDKFLSHWSDSVDWRGRASLALVRDCDLLNISNISVMIIKINVDIVLTSMVQSSLSTMNFCNLSDKHLGKEEVCLWDLYWLQTVIAHQIRMHFDMFLYMCTIAARMHIHSFNFRIYS